MKRIQNSGAGKKGKSEAFCMSADHSAENVFSSETYSDLTFEELYKRLMGSLELYRDLSDEEILMKIDDLLSGRNCPIRLSDRAKLRTELFNAVRRLDVLQELIDDDSITEVMVNGTDGIFYEKDGILRRWPTTVSTREKLTDIAGQIVAACNRVVNEASPIVDARLVNGARVNIVMPPVAVDGPIITIRRFPDHPIDLQDLLSWGSITPEAAEFLHRLVIAGYNIFISGGTGSGKTTFLNVLTGFIPSDERIITIEDNCELQIQGIENLVRLEARAANDEGSHTVSIRDLIRASLRMRPNRIIVGEVRGEETIDMLQALNTGHDGSLSTGHGNSPSDMLSRLETMYSMGMSLPISAIRRQIASGIDILVHLGRIRDRSRKVLEIAEVDGYDYQTGQILMHTLYEFREHGQDENGKVHGRLTAVGQLASLGKLRRAGITLVQASLPDHEISPDHEASPHQIITSGPGQQNARHLRESHIEQNAQDIREGHIEQNAQDKQEEPPC